MIKSLKIFLCSGLFLAVVLLAAPPGAMASDSLFIESQTTLSLVSIAGDSGSAIIKTYDGDIMALDSASGMEMDFAANESLNQWIASESYSVAKGGAASAFSRPGSLT